MLQLYWSYLIRLPLTFHYVLGVYIFIIHFEGLSLMPETTKILNFPEN